MNIKLDKSFTMMTYSKDLIGIKKGNKTVASYKDIIGALKWFDKNGYKGIKNRVEAVLLDLTSINIDKVLNSFKTDNYKVEFDEKREFTITDLSNRNNVRWIYNKVDVLSRIYHLEINRLNVISIDDLIEAINRLNISFSNVLTRIVK